jgi:hypothetical protein
MRILPITMISNVCAAAVLAVGVTAFSPASAAVARTIRLDAGSVIPVRLNDKLSSADSRKGDTFTATVKTSDGEDYGLPDGTKVDGRVTGARPQRDKDAGVIEVSFERIRLPDGHSYAIDGSLIGLDNKSVERRANGRLVATPSHQNDRLTYAGYGAGAGLIVGILTRRPIEDAVLGGLLGYGFSALQKNHSDARDVVLKPGTEMGVRIDKRAVLTDYESTGDSQTPRDSEEGHYRISTDRRDYGVGARTDERRDTTNVGDVGVMIDDRDVRFESGERPIITRNDVVLVPVVPVLHAARIPYTYNGRTETLRATGSAEPVRATIGSRIAVVNGSDRVRLEAPVQRRNGVLYAPMKFLALATGYSVHYDSGSRTVVLNSQ